MTVWKAPMRVALLVATAIQVVRIRRFLLSGVATEFGFYSVVGFGHGSPSPEIQANSAALAWPGCQINDRISDGQFMSWKQAKSCQTTCHLIYVP